VGRRRISPRSFVEAVRRTLNAVWATWRSRRLLAITQLLLLAAVALLGLSAAGTVEITFTLQPSYGLLGLAVLCGLPWAAEGWLRMPRSVRLAAVALVCVYLVATLTGSPERLTSQGRGGALRSLVYVVDLLLGLTTLGLIAGICTHAFARRLLAAFCVGATLTAGLAIYQWFALHFALPLSDINNAPNSDGFSRGHSPQGAGILGWERTRGTFKEPLVLGTFCAITLPLVALAALGARGRGRVVAAAGLPVVAFAFLLTVSSLSIGVFVATGSMVALIVALRNGRVRLSGVFGAVVVLGLVMGPVLFSNPSALSALTGRSGDDLRLTADNRKVAWDAAVGNWQQRPVLGYGPGQSSVRLAYRPDPRAVNRTHAPVVLGSAQGIWSASLIDAGIAGFGAWAALFLSILVFGARALWRERGLRLALVFWAASSAAVLSQFTGDRLDIRVWIALGALLAASQLSTGQTGRGHHEANQPAEERPEHRVGGQLAHR